MKTHTCEAMDNLTYNCDDIEYEEELKEWRLHLDCHCCSTQIMFCPYCGEKLDAQGVMIPHAKELDKDDLISLVKGTPPNFSVMHHPVVQICGVYNGGHNEGWSWNTYRLQECTEVHLLEIYKLCKDSWKSL